MKQKVFLCCYIKNKYIAFLLFNDVSSFCLKVQGLQKCMSLCSLNYANFFLNYTHNNNTT